MDLLPVEMKAHILSFLDARTLHTTVPKVCEEWGLLAVKILEERVTLMENFFQLFPSYRTQILSYLPPPSPTSGPAEEEEDNSFNLLCLYENAFLGRNFHVRSKQFGEDNLQFISSVHQIRRCDCMRANECVVRSIHFMPCHHLLVVQVPEKIDFYSMDALMRDDDKGRGKDWNWDKEAWNNMRSKYRTSVFASAATKSIWIDNNTHTAISVWNDKIVCQETTRALILLRVRTVNHSSKSVVLENLRRIFLPLWSCDLMMISNRVCALFTTGTVGVWNSEIDEIQVSTNSCVDTITMRNMLVSKMSVVGNLIMVKIVTDEIVHWSVFDPEASSEIRLTSVDFSQLLSQVVLPSPGQGLKLLDVLFVSNLLVASCEVPASGPKRPKPSTSANASCRLYSRRLKKVPTISDFLNTDNHLGLEFCNESSQSIPVESNEYLTTPILWYKHKEVNHEATHDVSSTTVVLFGLGDNQRIRRTSTSSLDNEVVRFRGTNYLFSND